MLHSLDIPISDVIGCGVGIPGTVSADGRSIVKAPNISILPSHLADELEPLICVPVKLIQDAKAAAYGEYVYGAGKNAKSLLCFTLGTGIGMGIVVDGKIYQGGLGCAGEIGHIPLGSNRKCGCGKIGCIEKYAAGGGLDITARELLGENKTASDLFDAAQNGNENAQSHISEAITMLGTAITAAVNLFSPDVVLFSGGLSERQSEYVIPLTEFILNHCYNSGTLPRINTALLGSCAPLIGAAAFV
jgi:glucokinase